MSQKLEELLKKKDLNDRKWSLLYQGSRDGFGAFDFHFRCDHKSYKLTIVKSTNCNIFGGFANAQWMPKNDLWQEDKRAFIFSLINKENRPLLFEHTSSNNDSICLSSSFGPVFGGYYDLFICDNSNENTFSFSNLGSTYTHPEYPYGSEKAKTILALILRSLLIQLVLDLYISNIVNLHFYEVNFFKSIKIYSLFKFINR